MSQPASGLVRVALRISPQKSPDSIFELHNSVKEPGHIITIADKNGEKSSSRAIRKFMFDTILPSNTSQDVVFDQCVSPLIDNVLQGFNACFFTYGQGGSGKSHSLYGRDGEMFGDGCGVLPRSLDKIFNVIEQRKFFTRFELMVSFYEICDDDVGDLGSLYLLEQQMKPLDFREYMNSLQQKNSGNKKRDSIEYPMRTLEIVYNQEGKAYACDLSDIIVNSKSQVLKVIESGLRGRSFIENGKVYSNRAHTIISITVSQKPRASTVFAIDEVNTIVGRMHFIELADSEFRYLSKAADKSFGAISLVTDRLQQGESRTAPESKITSLLESDLEQNCFVSILCTISPSTANFDESLATLQYAHRCKNPSAPPVAPVIDISTIEDKDRRIKELENTVLRLHKEINGKTIYPID
jgi:kinesin family protein 11